MQRLDCDHVIGHLLFGGAVVNLEIVGSTCLRVGGLSEPEIRGLHSLSALNLAPSLNSDVETAGETEPFPPSAVAVEFHLAALWLHYSGPITEYRDPPQPSDNDNVSRLTPGTLILYFRIWALPFA